MAVLPSPEIATELPWLIAEKESPIAPLPAMCPPCCTHPAVCACVEPDSAQTGESVRGTAHHRRAAVGRKRDRPALRCGHRPRAHQFVSILDILGKSAGPSGDKKHCGP